jgi:hypothetical protein
MIKVIQQDNDDRYLDKEGVSRIYVPRSCAIDKRCHVRGNVFKATFLYR